ncbi:MAG: hypothetical protein SGBAC_010154 [Bacillariaceae sp.]
MNDDDSAETASSRKDRLTRMKSRLSSASKSLQQQIKAIHNTDSSTPSKNEILEKDESELGPMNNLMQQEAQHKPLEPEMEIVGDTCSSTNTNRTKNISFQDDHEQDESSLAQFEFRRESQSPVSPERTINKSMLQAHTPETIPASSSDEDEYEEDSPMDEQEMDQENPEDELLQEASYQEETLDVDSSTMSFIAPPTTNRTPATTASSTMFVEDSATVSTTVKAKEGWLLQLVRDTLLSTIVDDLEDANSPLAVEDSPTKQDDGDGVNNEIAVVSADGQASKMPITNSFALPRSQEAFPDSFTSMIDQESTESDCDIEAEDEYVSLSDKLQRKHRKRRTKQASRIAKMKSMVNCSSSNTSVVMENNSYDVDEDYDIYEEIREEEADRRAKAKQSDNSYTPFCGAMASMIDDIVEVPGTIGNVVCVPMFSCVTEEDDTEKEMNKKGFEDAVSDLMLYA